MLTAIRLFTGSIDVTWQPEKERVVYQLGEEEAQGKFHDSLSRKKNSIPIIIAQNII